MLDAEAVRVKTQVFQPGAAWMMVDVLKSAVSGGTGGGANLKSFTTAGKTGTHSEGKSITFTGLTGYYACSVTISHDDNKAMAGAWGGTQSAPLFKNIMLAVHQAKGLANRNIIEDDPKTLGLVKATVCGVSGLRATEACSKDLTYKTVGDWFLKGTVPGEACNMHFDMKNCSDTHKLATQYCPADEVVQGSVLLIPSDNLIRKLSPADLSKYFPTALLDFPDVDDLSKLSPDNPKYAKAFCDYHTEQWAEDKAAFDALSNQTNNLIANVRNRMQQMGGALSEAARKNLNGKITAAQTQMAVKFVALPTPVNPATEAGKLQAYYTDLQSYADAVLVMPTPTPPPPETTPVVAPTVTTVPLG